MSQAFSRRMPGARPRPRGLCCAGGAPAAHAATSVIVTSWSGSGSAQRTVLAAGGRVERRLPSIEAVVARVPDARVAALRHAAGVRDVTRDRTFVARQDTAPGDDGMPLSAVRTSIGAVDTFDGTGVGVALIDSGVTPVAGLTAADVVLGPDFSGEAADPLLARRDGFGHGTHSRGSSTASRRARGW